VWKNLGIYGMVRKIRLYHLRYGKVKSGTSFKYGMQAWKGTQMGVIYVY